MNMNTLRLFTVFITMIAFSLIEQAQSPYSPSEYSFQDYERDNHRNYKDPNERRKRKQIWNKRMDDVRKLNDQYRGRAAFGPNQYSDCTDEEIQKIFDYHPQKLAAEYVPAPEVTVEVAASIPTGAFDYRTNGKVTPVRNQYTCGSCWAFSSTAAFESLLMLQGMSEFDLSEQHVLTCSEGGNCSAGGFPYYALQWALANGITTQAELPYSNADGAKSVCSTVSAIMTPETISSSLVKHYSSKTDDEIKNLLYNYGPFSVGVAGYDNAFFNNRGGVFKCTSPYTINHAVLLIGWDAQGNWIIKNSWGSGWGTSGYGYIDKSGNCGVGDYIDMVQFPHTNQPITVPVQTIKYSLTLTDTGADGWNGATVIFMQNLINDRIIGNLFTSGNEMTQQVDVAVGDSLLIKVGTTGSYSHQIGFTLTSETGEVMCSREPGFAMTNEQILCRVCPQCRQVFPSDITYSYTLTVEDTSTSRKGRKNKDSTPSGYDGTKLAFRYDGASVQIGGNFISGTSSATEYLTLPEGIDIELVVLDVPSGVDTTKLGYIVKDNIGATVLQRSGGNSFVNGQTLSLFRTKITQGLQVSGKLSSSVNTESTYESTEVPSSTALRSYKIAVAILSILVAVFISTTIYCYILKQRALRIPFQQQNPTSYPVVASANSFGNIDIEGGK